MKGILNKRIVTALVLTALWLVAVVADPIFWLVFITFFAVVGCIEFTGIVYREKYHALKILLVLASLVFPLGAYLQVNGLWSVPAIHLLLGIAFLVPVLFILSRGAVEDFVTTVPMAFFGAIWLCFLPSLFIFIRYLKIGGASYGPEAIFFMVVVVGSSDIGAYYTGKAVGRHKMSPLYSPKKTWEGVLGGYLWGLAFGYVACFSFARKFGPLHAGAMAVLLVLFAQFGDLVESVFKRSCKIKDAGEFLPGHGGVLDRIDAILFAVIVYYLYLDIAWGL